MEGLQNALAAIPDKYVADFTALLQDPLFQQWPNPRCRTVIARRILREKKQGIPFSVIVYFFLC
jgi:hypothetical protein